MGKRIAKKKKFAYVSGSAAVAACQTFRMRGKYTYEQINWIGPQDYGHEWPAYMEMHDRPLGESIQQKSTKG